MSNNDAPAGGPGGQFSVSELPEKLRVHALAKLIGRTSKEVLTALAEVGSPASSAQAGVDRKTAEQVVTALLGEQAVAGGADTGASAPEAPAAGGTAEVDGAGGVAEPAGPSGRARKAPAAESAPAAEAAQAPGGAEAAEAGGAAEAEAPATPKRTRSRRSPAAAVFEPPAAEDTPAAEPATPAAAPLSPVFAPPAALFQVPAPAEAPARRPRRKASDATATDDAPAGTQAEPAADGESETSAPPRRRRRRAAGSTDDTETAAATEIAVAPGTVEADSDTDSDADSDDEDRDDERDEASDEDRDEDGAARRRRRRGRRGRGRGKGEASDDDADDETGDDATGSADDENADDSEDDSDEDGDTDESDEAGSGGSRRRRRRRRRKGSGDGAEDRTDDDPPNTVTRVRQPRDGKDTSDDGVQSVRGSTRLEAKRQRRRDGRDAGRRRPPILSESEFLARRESVERSMVIRQTGQRNEIGVLEDGVLVEHFIAGGAGQSESMVGNIYLGRVQNVLPSMEAAFVDIGRGRNAVLYAGEVDWDAAGLNGKARRIEQALSSGDSVLVQVTKDPVGHKGARLTTQISLAGRFLVYVPSGGAAGISRKLPDVERKRLKDMLKEIVPSEAGVIIRTASEGVTHEALEHDVRRLQAQWEVVREKSSKTGPKAPKAPTLLYEEPDLLVKVVRDQFNEDFASLVVSGDSAWDTVSDYVSHVAPELAERMHRHVGPRDVFAEYRIDEQLLKALDRKVWLPSGGTLVIDRTEAMTVVDVNTGKFTGSGGNLEETVTRNNLEAAEEIVRQLRLRDIGGIIVIDFIDMVLEANRDLVLRRLTECLARDRTRHQVAEVTSLGLVQMTRKRVGGGLLEHFSTPCEACRGRGVIVSVEGADHSHANGSNGHAGNGNGSSDGGGRKRNRRRDERADQPDQNGRSASAGFAVVAAAGHAPAADPDVADAPAGAVAEDVLVESAPVTEPDAAPVTGAVTMRPAATPSAGDEPVETPGGMDEPDTGRPAKRRGRRRAERPAGSSGAAPAVVVTEETPATPDTATTDEATTIAPASTATEGNAEVLEPAPEGPVPSANGHAPDAPAEPTAEAPAEPTADTPADTTVDPEPKPEKRRRGRVTRSAGAPSTAAEPVVVTSAEPIVVTAPAPTPAPTDQAAPDQPEQPEPEVAVISRPRRSRRAASRPAGPPADGAAADPVTVTVGAQDHTGDPV